MTEPLASRGLKHLLLGTAALIGVYPLVWTFVSSFKSQTELYTNPWWLPTEWHWNNWSTAWVEANVGSYLWNSVVATVLGLALLLLLATPAAYGLARLEFAGRRVILALFLLSLMIPPESYLVPLFMFLRDVNLLNTRASIIFVYASMGLSFSIFVLYTYFDSLPAEFEESARVDGASRWQSMRSIALPLIAPGFIVVAVFQGLLFWNDLVLALLFIRDPNLYTYPVGLLSLTTRHGTDWPLYFSVSSMVTLPVVGLFLLGQRQFVHGLARGGLKG